MTTSRRAQFRAVVLPRSIAAVVALALGLVGQTLAGSGAKAAAATVTDPDIIVILTDDQRAGTQRAMPFTWSFFTGTARGVDYPNAQVPTNLCCPSRTALLTGRLPTVTGAWDNGGRYGGVAPMARWQDAALPVQLSAQGYATGLFGKYLNGYGSRNRNTFGSTPPGWDVFNVYSGRQGSGYYSAVRGLGGRGYSTDSLGLATADFIASAPADQPLFAYYSPFAPHKPYDAGPYKGAAGPRLQRLARSSGALFNPAFDTVRRGQPAWLQRLKPVRAKNSRRVAREQTDAMMGVDANVARIVAAVSQNRDIDNTLFVFMSDNGYSWGDHRLVAKRSPYVSTNEIPLMVRYPGSSRVPRPGEDPRLANNVDVTATILSVAGAANSSDGLPLNGSSQHRYLPLMAAATRGRKNETPPRSAYCGVRGHRWSYLAYGSGETELYDLARDPFQIDNVVKRQPAVAARLAARTASTGCDAGYLDRVIGPYLPGADE